LVCKSCGHHNPEKNRYCGMCGVRLEATAAPARETTPPRPAAPAPQAPPATASRVAAAASRSRQTSILGLDGDAPAPPAQRPRTNVAGPSFLGLNSEPDPTSYLLDEEDEAGGHRGLWVALGLLVALAAAGFYFRAELRTWAAPLYAAVLERVNPKPPAPAAPPSAPAATDSATATSAPPATANDTPSPAAASPAATPEDKPASTPDTKADAKPPEPAKPAPDVAAETAPKKKPEEPAKLARASRPKPRVAEAVAPKDDPLLKLAQKYIHGQGVRQDCTTGMAYLREAAKRSNPEAASQMGALYATGTCVVLDRVAAYRWFTSAMQMAPSNPWLGQERDKLYGHMTIAERRQADQQSPR